MKKMVLENITFLLNNFIHCPAYENVIFCWVMHEQEIIDDILSRLDATGGQVHSCSLARSGNALKKRLQKDVESEIRSEDVIARSMERIGMYESLDTVKIDVSSLSPEETAQKIVSDALLSRRHHHSSGNDDHSPQNHRNSQGLV